MSDNKSTSEANTCSRRWTHSLQACTKPILRPFLALSHHAATHPKLYIVGTVVISLLLMIVGLVTNFNQATDDSIWTPQGSRPLEHGNWVDDDSGFPVPDSSSVIIVHRDGKPLFGENGELALESARRMMNSLEYFRSTPRFDELCLMTGYIHPSQSDNTSAVSTCQVVGASSFWNDSKTAFDELATSNEAVLETMSAPYYPYGSLVDHNQIIGYNKFDNATGLLMYGQSYVTVVLYPPDKEDSDDHPNSFSNDFEKDVLDRMLDLQDQWMTDNTNTNGFRIEIISGRSFNDEFGRALTRDLPLIPVVFLLMSILCIGLFARRDPVLSRGWLGFGAVCTVLLAIIASFGLLFLIGE